MRIPVLDALLAPLDRLVGAAARRSIEGEQTYVKHPERGLGLFLRESAIAVLAFGALIANGWADGGWVGSVSLAIVGGFVGFALFGGLKRANAYRNGWIDGRHRMVSALTEAMHREMTIEEWLDGEIARDFAVMGVPFPIPSDGEED